MFESLMNFLKKITKKEDQTLKSKDAAKERLHLVLMQDRANVSADFLDLMKQEIIEVIKKYIDIDEKAIDVRLTNKENSDGTNGAPALYANIPILNIKDEARKNAKVEQGEKKENKNQAEKAEAKDKATEKVKNVDNEENKQDENKKEENKEEKKEEKKEGKKQGKQEGNKEDQKAEKEDKKEKVEGKKEEAKK